MYKSLIAISVALSTTLSASYVGDRKERARQWYKAKFAKVKEKKRSYQRHLEYKLKGVGRKASKQIEKAAKELKHDDELRHGLYDRIEERCQEERVAPAVANYLIEQGEIEAGKIDELPLDQQMFFYSRGANITMLKKGLRHGEFNWPLIKHVLDSIPDDLSHRMVEKQANTIVWHIARNCLYNDELRDHFFKYKNDPKRQVIEELFSGWKTYFEDYYSQMPPSDAVTPGHTLVKLKVDEDFKLTTDDDFKTDDSED